MIYNYKSTGLASVAALAVGAVVAFAPVKAEALTVLDPPALGDPGDVISYELGTLDSDDYELAFDINVRDAFETLFDFRVSGTGTLTINTFVDPAIPRGIGTSDLRLGTAGPLGSGSLTAEWGTGGVVDLSDGVESAISTSFSGSDIETLVFDWSDISPARAVDAGVSAVPLPAAGWLMIAGLGGLAALRRRKRAA